MAATEKVRIALSRDDLRNARVAAEQDGVSLSVFVARAVRAWLEERGRLQAARQLLATFAPEEFPTEEERGALLALWASPRAGSVRPRSRRRQY